MIIPFSDYPAALALWVWLRTLALAVVGSGGWLFLMALQRRACAWGRDVQVWLLRTLGLEARGVGGVSYPVWVSPSAPGEQPYPFAAAGILIHGPGGVRVVAEFGPDDRQGQPLTWACAAPHPGRAWPLAVVTRWAGGAGYLALTAPGCPPLYVYRDHPEVAAGRPDPVLTRALGQALAAPPGPPPSAALMAQQARYSQLVNRFIFLMAVSYFALPKPPDAQLGQGVVLLGIVAALVLAWAVARGFIRRGMRREQAWLLGLPTALVFAGLLELMILPWLLRAASGL